MSVYVFHLVGTVLISRNIPRHLLGLEKVGVAGGEMRKHQPTDANAMLNLFLLLHVCQSVAMGRRPACSPNRQDQTRRNDKRWA